MSSESILVRRIYEPTSYERNRILEVYLSAFEGDMMLAAMTGGRTSMEIPYFTFQLNLALKQGQVYVAVQGGTIIGAIFVYPPGQDFLEDLSDRTTPMNVYLSRLTPEMVQWYIVHLQPKYNELTELALGSHETRKSTWYIKYIAVHADKQRKGAARHLIDYILRKADEENQHATVEVQNDTMVRIFHKFGFKVRITKNFGSYQGGFPLFSMLRPAKTLSTSTSTSSSSSATA